MASETAGGIVTLFKDKPLIAYKDKRRSLGDAACELKEREERRRSAEADLAMLETERGKQLSLLSGSRNAEPGYDHNNMEIALSKFLPRLNNGGNPRQ